MSISASSTSKRPPSSRSGVLGGVVATLLGGSTGATPAAFSADTITKVTEESGARIRGVAPAPQAPQDAQAAQITPVEIRFSMLHKRVDVLAVAEGGLYAMLLSGFTFMASSFLSSIL